METSRKRMLDSENNSPELSGEKLKGGNTLFIERLCDLIQSIVDVACMLAVGFTAACAFATIIYQIL